MQLKGIYTVKQDNKILARSHNQITTDGFKLAQKLFSNVNLSNLKRIDVYDKVNTVTINSNGIESSSIKDVKQIFANFTNNKCFYTNNINAAINVLFQKNSSLYSRKIYAIGIDFFVVGNNVIESRNTNIEIRYSNDLYNVLPLSDVSQLVMATKSLTNIPQLKNYEQRIFYLSKPTDISQIKIKFNTFCNELITYYIYAINLYQYQQVPTPPTHMTLYGKKNNLEDYSISNSQKKIQQQIEMSYPNDSNGYSTIFKTLIPYDALNTTTTIYAISTDYYENGIKKQFSYSQYTTPWQQQLMTNIQLQYQLFFSNQQNFSSNSSNSSNNSIGN